MKNFALTGVGGFIAPRHLKAIRDTGNRLCAAVDPRDSVGILDHFGSEVRFFTEIERFDRYLEKMRRAAENERIHYLSVCSPTYLHDAHCRLGLRVQAEVICEKPLVINPWNLDALQDVERESGHRVWTIFQLRAHPQLVALRESVRRAGRTSHPRQEVVLTYVTSRGPWYDVSWKGRFEKSGGLATNIGIHFFDMLLWMFGPADASRVHLDEPRRMAGLLELECARVRWFLSVNASDLPAAARAEGKTTHRSIEVDGTAMEFSDGFDDLHTRVYELTLAGKGFGIEDARHSIALVHAMRKLTVSARSSTDLHPLLQR